MVQVRHGFFHYRAFWMTAGLSAGAATWVLAIEPVPAPVLLQPVPESMVVQTQAQAAPQQPLRTQQAGTAPAATSAQPGPKSAVQLKLEELYQQDGRQMPDLPDPQIPRQTSAQASPAPSPAPAPLGAAAPGLPARPISSSAPSQQMRPASPGTAGQQGAIPQNATWAQAQAAGAPRSTPTKKVPWIEQINPFRKRVSAAPPTEPAEIQYDPRQAAGQFAQPQVQPQQLAQQPRLQPGQVNPQTGRQNYSQLFSQPQTFAAPPPQGDPFVAATPMSVAATPQLTPANTGTDAPAPAAQVAAAPVAIQPAPQTFAAPATPAASLPVLDFRPPVPVTAAPTQPFTAQAPSAASQQPAAQVAQLPLVLPQNPPSAAGPQNLVPQSMPAATPPSIPGSPDPGAGSPFTGLGLNDALLPNATLNTPTPNTSATVQAPAAGQPAAVATVPPPQMAALPTPPDAATSPVAAAPQSLPKLEGFFSDEEERQTDQSLTARLPEQPRPLVVPTPPPTAEEPAFELPKAAAAPLVVASPSLPDVPPPADVAPKPPAEFPKLEFPSVAAAPQSMPAGEIVQPGSVPPLQPVPRQANGAAASKMALIAARTDQRGLKGFCPVMLRDHRELIDASTEHRSFYRNRIILLSSQEAKVVFESDPSKYAPAAAGNDVIHLSQTGEELEGSLEHAVWYKGRLYMFDSAETLETFVAAPSSHATND